MNRARFAALAVVVSTVTTAGFARAAAPSADEFARVCQEEMLAGKIPGLAVTLVERDRTVFERGFGYADTASKSKVDENTAFELASNSKALTGLAFLSLVERYGLTLDDRIDRFLPWLDLRWENERAIPTLGEFLHQTSGVPANAVEHLPTSAGATALETTLREMMPMALSHAPGAKFEYSSINYDVLGLVIEKVSSGSFARFTDESVLAPAGLGHTKLRTAASELPGMATGYKLGFWNAYPYVPPPFEGNGPAAYFTSTADDQARWLKIQLAAVPLDGNFAALIRRSHASVPSAHVRHASYGSGWVVDDDGTIYHEGSNPTFSSFVGFDEASSVGVAVLANLNSEHTFHLGQRLLGALRGRSVTEPSGGDEMMTTDHVASSVTLALMVLAGIALVAIARTRRRQRADHVRRRIVVGAIVLGMYWGLVYAVPIQLAGGTPWGTIRVWAPWSVTAAAVGAALVGLALFAVWCLRVTRHAR